MKPAKQALGDLERKLQQAVQDRDLDRLDRLLGEEFVLVTGRPGAETRDRAEWLQVTVQEYAVESWDFAELDVREYGHVGLVQARYTQQARLGDEDRSGDYLLTDLWVRRKGDWIIVHRHLSPLATPPLPEGGTSG